MASLSEDIRAGPDTVEPNRSDCISVSPALDIVKARLRTSGQGRMKLTSRPLVSGCGTRRERAVRPRRALSGRAARAAAGAVEGASKPARRTPAGFLPT